MLLRFRYFRAQLERHRTFTKTRHSYSYSIQKKLFDICLECRESIVWRLEVSTDGKS